MTPILSAPIPSTTARSRSQIVGRPKIRNTCQESKQQCAERFDRKFTASGDTSDHVRGWASRVSRVTRDFALCGPDRTTSSWSIAHVNSFSVAN